MAKKPQGPRLGVEFTAEVYRRSALERAGSLRGLYDSRDYVLAIYVSGVAVEAMFRAYRTRIDPMFSSRHDLHELERDSKFAESVPPSRAEEYRANLGTVASRWSNNHRYRSEAAMRKYLKRAGMDRGIKGDELKENTRLVVNAAVDLVTLGEQIWNSK